MDQLRVEVRESRNASTVTRSQRWLQGVLNNPVGYICSPKNPDLPAHQHTNLQAPSFIFHNATNTALLVDKS